MKTHVRQAIATDLDAIFILNSEVQVLHASLEFKHFRLDADEGEVRAFFAGRLQKANHEIWLAESLGRRGGYVWFERQESRYSVQPDPSARLRPSHRRRR